MKKRIISLLLCASMVGMLAGCGNQAGGGKTAGNRETDAVSVAEESDTAQESSAEEEGEAAPADQGGETASLKVAYQFGMAYAPMVICQDQELIEKAYKEATGNNVEIEWNQMSSGTDINTAFSSGDLDVGLIAFPIIVTGVSKNLGYKIFANMCGQEHGLMTNDDSIQSLGDLVGSDSQISLLNLNTFHHIALAKALVENGYDAHALDENVVSMSHPDGMNALIAGSVTAQATSNPYIYKERQEEGIHELTELKDAYPIENSYILGVASEELYDNNPELYKALCDAVNEAIDLINTDLDKAAEICSAYDGNTVEDEKIYLEAGYYTPDTKGILELAQFMEDNGFVEDAPDSYSDYAFDNVQGD